MSTPAENGPAAPSPTDDGVPAPRQFDPERGLRGVMSAILVLEAVTILLGLTVIANGGVSAAPWKIGVVCALAVGHLAACVVISKRYALTVIWILQALLICCWAIHAAIGAMGIVFGAVWVLVLLMRREFRRRLAAGTIAGAPRSASPAADQTMDTEGTGT